MIIEELNKEINILQHRLVEANRAERRVLREEINRLVSEREEIKSMYAMGETMTQIQKDTREWDVVVVKPHDHCEFVSYPANYHACNHPSAEHVGETECNMDMCPLKRDGFVQVVQPYTNLNEAIDSLMTTITTDSRDWSLSERDAWIYGIVVGWGNALPEVSKKFGWSDENVCRLQKYHNEVCRGRQHDKELKQ